MWQKIKVVSKDWKTYVSMLVSAFGFANNYFHLFLPLAPSLRLPANVFVFLAPMVAVGVTVSKMHDKKSSGLDYGKSGRWTAALWAAAGFITWSAYAPILTYLEGHSSSVSVSRWFDAFQTGAYVLPFVCWSIALAALLCLLP